MVRLRMLAFLLCATAAVHSSAPCDAEDASSCDVALDTRTLLQAQALLHGSDDAPAPQSTEQIAQHADEVIDGDQAGNDGVAAAPAVEHCATGSPGEPVDALPPPPPMQASLADDDSAAAVSASAGEGVDTELVDDDDDDDGQEGEEYEYEDEEEQGEDSNAVPHDTVGAAAPSTRGDDIVSMPTATSRPEPSAAPMTPAEVNTHDASTPDAPPPTPIIVPAMGVSDWAAEAVRALEAAAAAPTAPAAALVADAGVITVEGQEPRDERVDVVAVPPHVEPTSTADLVDLETTPLSTTPPSIAASDSAPLLLAAETTDAPADSVIAVVSDLLQAVTDITAVSTRTNSVVSLETSGAADKAPAAPPADAAVAAQATVQPELVTDVTNRNRDPSSATIPVQVADVTADPAVIPPAAASSQLPADGGVAVIAGESNAGNNFTAASTPLDAVGDASSGGAEAPAPVAVIASVYVTAQGEIITNDATGPVQNNSVDTAAPPAVAGQELKAGGESATQVPEQPATDQASSSSGHLEPANTPPVIEATVAPSTTPHPSTAAAAVPMDTTDEAEDDDPGEDDEDEDASVDDDEDEDEEEEDGGTAFAAELSVPSVPPLPTTTVASTSTVSATTTATLDNMRAPTHATDVPALSTPGAMATASAPSSVTASLTPSASTTMPASTTAPSPSPTADALHSAWDAFVTVTRDSIAAVADLITSTIQACLDACATVWTAVSDAATWAQILKVSAANSVAMFWLSLILSVHMGILYLIFMVVHVVFDYFEHLSWLEALLWELVAAAAVCGGIYLFHASRLFWMLLVGTVGVIAAIFRV